MVCNSVQVITRFWAVTDMFADHLTKKNRKLSPISRISKRHSNQSLNQNINKPTNPANTDSQTAHPRILKKVDLFFGPTIVPIVSEIANKALKISSN